MRRLIVIVLMVAATRAALRDLLPDDLDRGRYLAARLLTNASHGDFLVIGLSDADPAAGQALALLPHNPRAVFDLKGMSRSRWLGLNETPMPVPRSLIFLLGDEGEDPMWKRLGTLIAMFRDSTFWNIRGNFFIEAPSVDFLEMVIENFAVFEATGLVWTGSAYEESQLEADGQGPGDTVIMTECAPELTGGPSGPFRPEHAEHYLGQLIIQRIPRLRGMACVLPFKLKFVPFIINGTISPGARKLYDGKILLGASGSLLDKFSIATTTYPHAQDDYCFEVLRAGTIPFMEGVVLVFSSSTWTAFAGSLLASVATEVIVSYGSGSKTRSPATRVISDSFFESLRTLVTGCFRDAHPAASAITGGVSLVLSVFRLRCLRLLLSACSLVVTNAFGGSLTSHLSRPRDAPNIDTVQQVFDAVRHVHVLTMYISRFEKLEEGDEVKRLAQKFTPTFYHGSSDEVRESVARGEPRALLSPRSFFRLYSLLPKLSRDGRPLLHHTRQCALAPAYKGMIVRRGSPLEPQINAIVMRALQGGLYHKFEHDSLVNAMVRRNASGALVDSPPPPFKPYALKLRHLGGAFRALAFAFAVATFVFATERFVAWATDGDGGAACGCKKRSRLSTAPPFVATKGLTRKKLHS